MTWLRWQKDTQINLRVSSSKICFVCVMSEHVLLCLQIWDYKIHSELQTVSLSELFHNKIVLRAVGAIAGTKQTLFNNQLKRLAVFGTSCLTGCVAF